MNLLQKAKEFIQTKSGRAQAFADREEALRTKISELEAKKSKLIADYDPSAPFDAKAIGKLDADIEAAHKEIEVLRENKSKAPEHDIVDAIKHIEGAKAEAAELIAKKAKDAEKARDQIAKAKEALLKAQAEHYHIIRQANDIKADVNETIATLKSGVDSEIRKLENERQRLEREIYNSTTSTQFLTRNDSQSQVDVLYAESGEVMRELDKLRSYVSPVEVGIPNLSNYRDGNGKTKYYVHADEQHSAVEQGIITK